MNSVLSISENDWTFEKYTCLPEGVIFEFIQGNQFKPPVPDLFHQRMLGEIFLKIDKYVTAQKLGELLLAPVDVILDQKNVVQPDLVFVATANTRLLERRGIMGAPDLVVEVISPSSVRRDRYDKRELYARFGVKEYWLADVANHSIEVLTLQNGSYQLSSSASGSGRICSAILPGFEMDLAQVG